MREVTDAKIVKIIEVESCKECPYLGWSGDIIFEEGSQVNTEYTFCVKYLRDGLCDMSTECDVSEADAAGLVWSKCPLPSAMCTEVEEKEP